MSSLLPFNSFPGATLLQQFAFGFQADSAVPVRNNLFASASPGSQDDVNQGYFRTSIWIESSGTLWMCVDATAGSASWVSIGGSGSLLWGGIQGNIENQADLIKYLNEQTPVPFGGPNLEIWLSPRTDGIAGTGTLSNPYDASTQAKLDAITDPLYLDDVPNVTLHFLEGNYTTGGVGMRNGWKIVGAGKDKTFILSKNTSGNAAFTTVSDAYSGQAVSGMTINCNYDANIIVNPGGGFAGVHVAGPNSHIRDVRVINSGGAGETFALWVVGSSTVPCNNSSILECEVLQVKTNCTPITISTISPTFSIGNRLQNNFISGDGLCIGLGHGNTDGCVVTGNSFTNCGNAIYSDTYGQRGTLIMGNQIVNCINGVYLTPVPGLNNITISNNSIAITESGITLPDLSANVLIQGNAIWQHDGASGIAISVSGTHSNTRILNNTLGPNQTSSITSTNKNLFGNRQYNGSASTGLEDTVLALGSTVAATNLSGTNTGDQYQSPTITPAGTTGNRTINNRSGSVNFAAGSSSLVVTNNLVTTNSIIIATIASDDNDMESVSVMASAGSFTIHANPSVPAAETRVNWVVLN